MNPLVVMFRRPKYFYQIGCESTPLMEEGRKLFGILLLLALLEFINYRRISYDLTSQTNAYAHLRFSGSFDMDQPRS